MWESTRAVIVYPHQLFDPHPACEAAPGAPVFLVEDPLFFSQYRFHPHKIAYHRATMAEYARLLARRGLHVTHVPVSALETSGDVVSQVPPGVRDLYLADPVDDWLASRLTRAAAQRTIRVHLLDSPSFLLTSHEAEDESMPLRMADFYRRQRTQHAILIDDAGNPAGGTWSLDRENRKRIPRSLTPPPASPVPFASGEPLPLPVTHASAQRWLDDFLATRIDRFGDYEDAIDARDDRWFHSLLSPMLNVGLLTPHGVVAQTLASATERERAGNPIPLNALEGFIRQIIGWREFMRMAYVRRGRTMRTRNFWNHTRPMPESFYQGTTGLPPMDRLVEKTNRIAWAHHIERLMVAGNLMVLCEIDPDAVYRWFMELYIDAYDWVMVPNVYAMSQYADGGIITTKPYISGSNYLRKMSDSPAGEWTEIWDGLFWRFIGTHRDFFAGNPRLSMMVRQLDRMAPERATRLRARAEHFLERLW